MTIQDMKALQIGDDIEEISFPSDSPPQPFDVLDSTVSTTDQDGITIKYPDGQTKRYIWAEAAYIRKPYTGN